MENGEQIVFIREVWHEDDFMNIYGFNSQEWVGKTILSINDRPAIEYLIEFANNASSFSKDVSNRFNLMLGLFNYSDPSWNPMFETGLFTIRNFENDEVPSMSDVLSMKFEDGSYINQIPWLWSPGRDFHIEILNVTEDGCGISKHTRQYSRDNNSNKRNIQIDKNALIDRIERRKFKSNIKQGPTHSEIYFEVYNNDTVIMHITSFRFTEGTYFDEIANWWYFAQIQQINKLIIDVRGNPGGNLCAAMSILSAFTPFVNDSDTQSSTLFPQFDTIQSNLGNVFFGAGATSKYCQNTVNVYCPFGYNSTSTGQAYDSIQWYSPGEQLSRGGSTSSYSERVYLNCGTKKFTKSSFRFPNILIVSDGYCGSSCAVFTNHLSEIEGVKTIVFGGLAEREEQMYFIYPGGMVSYSEILRFDFQLLNIINDPAVPPQLPKNSLLSFLLFEVYDPITTKNPSPQDIPLEFLWKPADHRILQWIFSSDDELYSSVSKFFEAL
eukprot:TRINITY_DN3537_c0_g1_i2.p1 TRINITY_DN3537_c0_g1~~TRINITY_DN3537_c0_g1_i2.p1  ORF type:complete len:495 (+),score=64.67 TRINITY_DN3537_c0_g1_i2:502-1986(+)